jgi:hypothetical protein
VASGASGRSCRCSAWRIWSWPPLPAMASSLCSLHLPKYCPHLYRKKLGRKDEWGDTPAVAWARRVRWWCAGSRLAAGDEEAEQDADQFPS